MNLDSGLDRAREDVLVEQPETGIRDACNVWLEAADGTLALRIGIEAVAENWSHHDLWFDLAFADGRVLSFRGPAPNTTRRDADGRASTMSAGGMQFRCIEPFRQWRVSFSGVAEETSTAVLARGGAGFETGQAARCSIDLEIDLTMAAPAWAPGSLSDEAARFLAGPDGEFMSPRYEQLCRGSGRIGIDQQTLGFEGNGLRIRRTGQRAFSGFRGHCWQSAVFADGRAFGFNTYPPESPGAPNYREGYIIEHGQRVAAIPVEVPWLGHLCERDEDVSCTLETINGRRIQIQGLTFINTRSRSHKALPPGFPVVQQAHAVYHWDDQQTTGMIERSSLPDLIDNLERST